MQNLDAQSETPLYQQLYLILREQIESENLKRPITKEKLRMARLAEGIKPQGLVPVPKVLKAGIVGANPAIANYLQIEKEEKVNLLQRRNCSELG